MKITQEFNFICKPAAEQAVRDLLQEIGVETIETRPFGRDELCFNCELDAEQLYLLKVQGYEMSIGKRLSRGTSSLKLPPRGAQYEFGISKAEAVKKNAKPPPKLGL